MNPNEGWEWGTPGNHLTGMEVLLHTAKRGVLGDDSQLGSLCPHCSLS